MASSASAESLPIRPGAAAMASLLRHEQRGMREIDRSGVVRRDDHPHADIGLVEQALGEVEGHAHAAVRGGIAGQRSAMQRDAVPGDALHVRHPGIVIHGRVVVLVLLDDGEDAGRRLASGGAGRDRRTQDPALGIVEGDLLALDRHDRHDRLAGFARRHRLGGLARLLRRQGASCSARSARPQPRTSQFREAPNAASLPWIAPSSVGLSCHSPVACPHLRRSSIRLRSLD